MSDERSSLRRRLLCRIVDFSKSPRARVRLVGVLGGLYLLVWCHGFLATWGTSLPAVAGLAAGLTLGLELAWLRRSRQNRPAATVGRTSSPSASVAFADGLEVRPTETETETETDTGTDGVLRRVPAWTPFALHLGLAAWTIALPWLSDAWSAVVARIPVTTLAVPAVTWIVLIAGGVLLLSVPAFLVAGAGLWGSAARKSGQPPFSSSPVDRHSADSHSAAECLRSWLVGVAGGLVLGVFIVAPTAGLEYGGTAAALVGAAIAVVHLMRGSRDAQGVLSIGAPAETHSASFETAAARWSKRSSTHLWTFAIGCIAGAFFAASQRLAHQLMPAASATLAVQWAALLLAAAGGLGWARRRHSAGRTQDEIEATVCLQAAVAFAIVPLVFPLLIDSILLLNSHVASVWMLLAGRSLLAGLLVAPAGACLGVVLARAFAPHGQPAAEHDNTASAAAEQQVRTVALPFASFALGLVAARLLITHGVASAMLAIVAAGLLALQGAARSLRNRPAAPAWRPRLVVAGACALPVVAAVWHTGHEPARAARLLFSTNVFLARQAGLNPHLLTAIDDGRLVALGEGRHGTHTLWKFRGVQFQLRDSGIPKAIISSDARICPQYPPEVMQAVLPLVLHDRPSRVLLLGLGGGVPLATCLRFPVLEVTYAESDAALVDLVRSHAWNHSAGRPFDDIRLTAIPLDPALTLAGRHQPWDVIISNADQSALASAGSCFTTEFYRRAARHLAADGIFCQRFQALDYGPMPLAVLARTMQTAFRSVVFVETGSGEYALLATNSPHGVVRDGLVERLQAPQVRDVLAEAGWDWSMILNLNTLDHDRLAEFAAEAGDAINTAGNGRLAYRLPQEIIRWAPKAREIQARLGPRATRFLNWHNVDGEDPDILRRLGEVAGLRNMMVAEPDQFWAYRKSVKEQITERPRSMIVPVKGDLVRELHPIERRRLDYFAALGDALRNHPPDPEEIRHVAGYAFPFDPLLSYFIHQEVAELYARLPERDLEAELPHRLHSVYFADGQDRSVRNVAAALVLLSEHPQAAPDPAARWDHVNGLLQMLQLRWQTRGAVPPRSSRIVLNDIEQSIAAVEAAFRTLDQLDRDEHIPHAHWPARRHYLERTLLRPLRTYRSQVLPHHLKRLRLLEKSSEVSPDAI